MRKFNIRLAKLRETDRYRGDRTETLRLGKELEERINALLADTERHLLASLDRLVHGDLHRLEKLLQDAGHEDGDAPMALPKDLLTATLAHQTWNWAPPGAWIELGFRRGAPRSGPHRDSLKRITRFRRDLN